MPQNKQIHLDNRPDGEAVVSNFKLVVSDTPALRDGQVLVRHHFLSLDPYMRGRMNDSKSYAVPQELGQTMGGGTVGEEDFEHVVATPALRGSRRPYHSGVAAATIRRSRSRPRSHQTSPATFAVIRAPRRQDCAPGGDFSTIEVARLKFSPAKDRLRAAP